MLIPVILAGGAGARLWPVSREAYPKPFIRVPDGKTLLQKTFERAASLPGVEAVITATNREYYFLACDEYAKANVPVRRPFLLEPRGRNTAPAIAMAALYASEILDADAQLLVLPADHLIEDHNAFADAVAKASALADEHTLVTFGVEAARAETAYGYIECGEGAGVDGAFRVLRFVEKPDAARASEFIASQRFLWNAGIFCFRAGAFMSALEAHAPAVFRQAAATWAQTDRSNAEKMQLDVSFQEIDDISVDYAIMEKHPHVAVVRTRFDWNDIGSWNAVAELTPADAAGNRISADAITVDAERCYIQSDSRVIAAVGVKNLIVIDTPDALLIIDKSRAQDVKAVVSQLRLRNHASQQMHRTVHRPWGTYTTLADGATYRIKQVVVNPQAALSLQTHRHRSEHWVVLSGVADVVNGSDSYRVRPSESTFIPAGRRHRLANTGSEALVLIEVQMGSYVGEDDITRHDDAYGRT